MNECCRDVCVAEATRTFVNEAGWVTYACEKHVAVLVEEERHEEWREGWREWMDDETIGRPLVPAGAVQ